MKTELPHVIVALGLDYAGLCDPLYDDNTINLTMIRPLIEDILLAIELPFNLLVTDPESLSAYEYLEEFAHLEIRHPITFGYHALKHLINQDIPTDNLQVFSFMKSESFVDKCKRAKLLIPETSISYVTSKSERTTLKTLIHTRLGTMNK